MENVPAIKKDEIVSSIVLQGDLSKLTSIQKVEYYNRFCESLSLNPLTMPFNLLRLSNKEVLYANKNCGEQLRKNNGVSVIEINQQVVDGVLLVNVKVQDKTGRIDIETGAVNISGLKGEQLANAMMKAVTKAKRRATLSICSVGVMDESELESIPEAEKAVLPIMTNTTGHVQPEIEPPKTPEKQPEPRPTAAPASPFEISDEARSQMLDLMTEMRYDQRKMELAFQRATLVGEQKALDGLANQYSKFLEEKTKAANPVNANDEEVKF